MNEPVQQESIRHRYSVTLMAQFLRWGLSFVVTSGIVPRLLGPIAYGNFNFIFNASSTLRSFLEPSAQQAFLTFSSQEKRSGPLTKLYGLVLVAQIVIVFTLIGLTVGFDKLQPFFPGQKLNQIVAITVLEWLLFLALSLQQLGDCKGLTVFPQKVGAVVAIANAAILVVLAYFHQLNLYTFVWVSLLSALVSTVVLGYWLLVVHRDLCWEGSLSDHFRPLMKRWWRFASPLILMEYYTPIITFASMYMIQAWYGSTEQGISALALRWSSPVLAFTSAALMIFWREIAHLTASGERDRARTIYVRFSRLLLFLALVLAFWLCLSSSTLVPILAGHQYTPAIPVLMIMAFYPVMQTAGHLTGASFKATERTVLYRNLGLILSIPEILLTYFFLAKRTAFIPGLYMGAVGMALKLVINGFIYTEVISWFDFRYYGLNYVRWLFQRLGIVMIIGTLAVLTLFYLNRVFRTFGLNDLTSLGLASIPYFAALAILVYKRPEIVGLTHESLSEYLQILVRKGRLLI